MSIINTTNTYKEVALRKIKARKLEQSQRTFGVTIVEYILADLKRPEDAPIEYYTHRDSYWGAKEWLANLLGKDKDEGLSRLLASLPIKAPSVCLICKSVHDGGRLIQGGKLWRSCPYCHPFLRSTDFDWEKASQTSIALLSDVHALLHPYLTRWQVEALICTYYGMLPTARVLG